MTSTSGRGPPEMPWCCREPCGNTTEPKGMPSNSFGFGLACTTHVPRMYLACTSHVPRMYRACTWLAPPNPLPSTWLVLGLNLACTWLWATLAAFSAFVILPLTFAPVWLWGAPNYPENRSKSLIMRGMPFSCSVVSIRGTGVSTINSEEPGLRPRRQSRPAAWHLTEDSH